MSYFRAAVWPMFERSTTINVIASKDHGPAHWARVWQNAQKIMEKTPDADPLVIELFCYFHDTMRDSDFHDPAHGARGYALAMDFILPPNTFREHQHTLFKIAMIDHDRGYTSKNPTVGACWDADRLDLPRVGITPDPKFFSTEAGKEILHDRLQR